MSGPVGLRGRRRATRGARTRPPRALEEMLGFTHAAVEAVPASGENAAAARRRGTPAPPRPRPLHLLGRQAGEREISPFGLVFHTGRWYLAGHDHRRETPRTFRVDRMRCAALGSPRQPPPDGFDAVSYVSRSLARVPWTWEVEAHLQIPAEKAAERIPATMGELTAADDGTSFACASSRST